MNPSNQDYVRSIFQEIWPDLEVKCWQWSDTPDSYVITVKTKTMVIMRMIYYSNLNRVQVNSADFSTEFNDNGIEALKHLLMLTDTCTGDSNEIGSY